MKKSYSVNTLSQFSQSEEQVLLDELGMKKNTKSPSELSIQNILGFSKSLSVRKSKRHGLIEHHLN
jgi:hypothetical protein